MKKTWIAIFLALMLAGCKVQQEIKLDTIVDIPLNPTEEATETLTEAQPTTDTVPDETIPQETDSPTEATQAAEKATTSKTSTGGSSTKTTTKKSGSTTKATEATKATVPSTAPTEAPTIPATEPPTQAATEPPTEAPTEYDAAGYHPGSLDYAVIDAINTQRSQAGLEPLSTDTRLCAIASARAYEVSFNWSHSRPDGSSFTTVLTQYGYGFSTASESLHNTYAAPSADTIVSKWMGSDANRANILSENVTKIGVGTYTAADGAVYTAALFVG